MMAGSSTGDSNSSLLASPAAVRTPTAATAISVEFTVTERNEVAEVVASGGAARVLESESFFDAGTGTRCHLQGQAEAMVFLVSVREDQRRIVAVSRCC